ncbi:MAG: hypothetical protein GY940_30470, partial [bacterium]|nr:hypothetical protein [bacterium]
DVLSHLLGEDEWVSTYVLTNLNREWEAEYFLYNGWGSRERGIPPWSTGDSWNSDDGPNMVPVAGGLGIGEGSHINHVMTGMAGPGRTAGSAHCMGFTGFNASVSATSAVSRGKCRVNNDRSRLKTRMSRLRPQHQEVVRGRGAEKRDP